MPYPQLPKCMTRIQQPVVLMILAWLALPRIKAAWRVTQDLFINQTCGDKHSLETKVNKSWKKKQLISKGKPGTMGRQAKFQIPKMKDKSNASACPTAKSWSHKNRQGHVPFDEDTQRQSSTQPHCIHMSERDSSTPRRGSGDTYICNTPDYLAHNPPMARIKPHRIYSV